MRGFGVPGPISGEDRDTPSSMNVLRVRVIGIGTRIPPTDLHSTAVAPISSFTYNLLLLVSMVDAPRMIRGPDHDVSKVSK